MAAPSLAAAFQIGVDVLRAVRSAKTKAVLFQTGSVTGDTVDADNVESWQHFGIVSMPGEASAGKEAPQIIAFRRGDRDVAVAGRDTRGLELAANLKPGETCIYAAGKDGTGQARMLMKQNGAIAFYTTKDNAEGGDGITFSINPDGSFCMMSPLGGISIIESKITVLSATGSGVELSASGVSVIGSSVTLGGGLNPPSGVMTYYTALGGIVPALTAFAAAFTTLSNAMAPIIAASTALPAEKTAATAAFGALSGLAAAITTAFSDPINSYSKVVSATE